MKAPIEQEIIRICLGKLTEVFGASVHLKNTQSIGGGCINHAVKLSTSAGDFFLKWNSSAPTNMFLLEAEGLNEMKLADSGLIIPEVIWAKETDETPGLLLTSFLKPPRDLGGFDDQLGRGLARLHRKSNQYYGFNHANYCGSTLQDNSWKASWPEFYANCRIRPLVRKIHSLRGMPVGELEIFERLIDRLPVFLSHPTQPSLIHGDLWSGNFMYTADGPALIDPACSYSDREMELGMMKLFGGFSVEVWRAYQEEFPLPAGWQQRIRLYQLYHVLNHYLIFGGYYGIEALQIAKEYL